MTGSATVPLGKAATTVICSPAASGRVAVMSAVPARDVAWQLSVDPSGPWKQARRAISPRSSSTRTAAARVLAGHSPFAFQYSSS